MNCGIKGHFTANCDRVCLRCGSNDHSIRDCTTGCVDLPKRSGVKREADSQAAPGRGSAFRSSAGRGIPGVRGVFPGDSGWQPWIRPSTPGAGHDRTDSLSNNRGGRGGGSGRNFERPVKMRHVAYWRTKKINKKILKMNRISLNILTMTSLKILIVSPEQCGRCA